MELRSAGVGPPDGVPGRQGAVVDRWIRAWPARTAACVGLILALAPLGIGCESPPQIVAIAPDRGATQVRSNAPVRISFDRDVNTRSVASRFRIVPSSPGQIAWESPHDLVFNHPALRPDTDYTVQLDQGYYDLAGRANNLDHSWRFRTESAPVLVSTSPAAGDASVDPAAYITLNFNREMDPASMSGAVSVLPGISPSVRVDPADGRRVQIAPTSLLVPNATYTVTVTTDARDVDGNQLRSGVAVSFSGGPARTLRHWITFIPASASDSAGEGIWMVDENRFPRPLTTDAAAAYQWSPEGGRLLVRSPDGGWSQSSAGGAFTPLALNAGWAAFLAPGAGLVYLRGAGLWQRTAAGADVQLASGVAEATVSPDGTRVAYTEPAPTGSEIWAYSVDLRAQYRLQVEPSEVTDLAWAPDGSGIAYRAGGRASTNRQIRVRALTGAGGTVTLASGQVGVPVWQPDSRHLIFSAVVNGGTAHKAFRLGVTGGSPTSLTAALGMPAADIDVIDPQPSPDGHQIAFLAAKNGRQQVWLMNADGTALSQLTNPVSFPYSCSALAWTRA